METVNPSDARVIAGALVAKGASREFVTWLMEEGYELSQILSAIETGSSVSEIAAHVGFRPAGGGNAADVAAKAAKAAAAQAGGRDRGNGNGNGNGNGGRDRGNGNGNGNGNGARPAPNGARPAPNGGAYTMLRLIVADGFVVAVTLTLLVMSGAWTLTGLGEVARSVGLMGLGDWLQASPWAWLLIVVITWLEQEYAPFQFGVRALRPTWREIFLFLMVAGFGITMTVVGIYRDVLGVALSGESWDMLATATGGLVVLGAVLLEVLPEPVLRYFASRLWSSLGGDALRGLVQRAAAGGRRGRS